MGEGGAPDPVAPEVKVIYIGGTGRTGSTLLERLLAQADGVFAGGELTFLWYALAGDGRCSCGERLVECPVWSPIVERSLSEGSLTAPDLVTLRGRYWSLHMPLMLVPGLHRRYLARLGPYRDVVRGTYGEIAAATGSRVIIDSSKEPHYSAILDSLPGMELFFLHLVRDPRAVAHSWSRTKVHGGFGPDHGMPRRGVVSCAMYYWVSNLGAEAIWRRRRGRYLRVRYEDLIADPTAVLTSIWRFAEEPVDVSFVQGRRALIGPLHTSWGNPNRFERGEIELHEDDAWRREMAVGWRALSTLLTWPWLVHYGYLRRRRGASGEP